MSIQDEIQEIKRMSKELRGEKPASQSKTIKNAAFAMLSTLVTYLITNVPAITAFIVGILPESFAPIAVPVIQAIATILGLFFGKRTIDGRKEATATIK